MIMTRRRMLATGAALSFAVWAHPRGVHAAASPIAIDALDRSQLVYLSPIVSAGRDSRCQAEVWFVHHAGAVYVCTRTDAWRAEAIRRGFDGARLWIGEFGVWKRAKGRYRSAPYLETRASLVSDPALHAEVLPVFGEKYASEWGRWGPRFRDGLADGSRVLLRYVYTP